MVRSLFSLFFIAMLSASLALGDDGGAGDGSGGGAADGGADMLPPDTDTSTSTDTHRDKINCSCSLSVSGIYTCDQWQIGQCEGGLYRPYTTMEVKAIQTTCGEADCSSLGFSRSPSSIGNGTSASLSGDGKKEIQVSVLDNKLTPTDVKDSGLGVTNTTTPSFTDGSRTSESQAAALNQNTAQVAAAQAHGQASQEASTKGVLTCAEGATKVDDNPKAAGLLLHSCFQSFEIASKMKDLEIKALENAGVKHKDTDPTLDMCEYTFTSPAAQEITDAFESKFGISKADFVTRMQESKGNVGVLTDMLGSKLPGDKLFEAISQASNASSGEKNKALSKAKVSEVPANVCRYEVNMGGKANATAKGNSLREKLSGQLKPGDKSKKSFDSGNLLARKPDADLSPTRNIASEHLSASDEKFFSDPKPAMTELTIFDVVHNKYKEKLPLFQRGHK